MRRFFIAAALLTTAAPSMAGDAPFCVYSYGPPQCFYYSVDTCRSAARASNGMCAPNNQPQQSQTQFQQPPPAQIQQYRPQTSITDLMKHMQDAGDAGRREGMERREFEARMALIRAQTEAAQRASQPYQPYPEASSPRFLCTDLDGMRFTTSTPAVGCVVIPGE